MKKVELHLHLDGSLRVDTIRELGIKKNLLPRDISNEEVKDLVSINKNDKTLIDYLKKFDLPIDILQTKENLKRVSEELVEDLINDDTIYAEIRVAPIQHIKEGLTPEEIVESILKGFKSSSHNKNIKVNLLLCAMRHLKEEDNMFLIDLAEKFRDQGVVGLDLAGNEKDFPVTNFNNFFKKAKDKNIPYTIHAGEASGPQSVVDAINIGAKRVGHGIRSSESDEAIEVIKKNKICLELCPKSNMDTHIYKDFKDYPIQLFLDKGIDITLNSDNRTVSTTDINNEIIIIKKHFNITDNIILQMNLNAINHAFISDEDKDKLKNQLLGD